MPVFFQARRKAWPAVLPTNAVLCVILIELPLTGSLSFLCFPLKPRNCELFNKLLAATLKAIRGPSFDYARIVPRAAGLWSWNSFETLAGLASAFH
jgi:hypothetical protein